MNEYLTQMLQWEEELNVFIQLLCKQKVRSYLEIGSKYGGSLYRIGRALPKGAKVVAVDLPGGTGAWEKTRVSLEACIAELKALSCDAHLVWGDSTNPYVVEQVRQLGPYDAVFIDANHTSEYVRRDWANYGPMARIVAFHDISWRRPPDWKSYKIEVPQFWDTIKASHNHCEIKLDPSHRDNGIGILFREERSA